MSRDVEVPGARCHGQGGGGEPKCLQGIQVEDNQKEERMRRDAV